jgi:hypothetical protein
LSFLVRRDERVAGRHRSAFVAGPRGWNLKEQRDCEAREFEVLDYLQRFRLFVLLFLLTTAKGQIAGGISIPSCRHSVHSSAERNSEKPYRDCRRKFGGPVRTVGPKLARMFQRRLGLPRFTGAKEQETQV